MLEAIMFVFSSFWIWLGFTILLLGALEIIGKTIVAVAYSRMDKEEE